MINSIKRCCLVLMILILAYMLSLTLTSCIPTSWIKENIEDSCKYFYTSEVDTTLYISGFTDAVMIDINYRIDSKKPLESSMKAVMISDEEASIEPLLRI